MLSSLARISAWQPTVTRFSRTRGVFPISSVTSWATLGRSNIMDMPLPPLPLLVLLPSSDEACMEWW